MNGVDPVFCLKRSPPLFCGQKRIKDGWRPNGAAMPECRLNSPWIATEMHPQEKIFFLKRGYNTVMMNRNYSSAIEDFRAAEKLDARYIYAYYYEGICLQELKRFDEAEQCYHKALDLIDEDKGKRDIVEEQRATSFIPSIRHNLARCQKKETLYGR